MTKKNSYNPYSNYTYNDPYVSYDKRIYYDYEGREVDKYGYPMDPYPNPPYNYQEEINEINRYLEEQKRLAALNKELNKGTSIKQSTPAVPEKKPEPIRHGSSATNAEPLKPIIHQQTGEKVAEQKTGTIGDLIKEKLGGKVDVTDVKNTRDVQRKNLAEKVISMFGKNGYVFGGYLRDEIAGVPFNDVDMYFPARNLGYESTSDYSIVSALKKAGLSVIDLGEATSYIEPAKYTDRDGVTRTREYRESFRVRKFEIEDRMNGVSIRFDAVLGTISGKAGNDHPFAAGKDADVNCLWKDTKGNLQVAPDLKGKFTVEGIKKNIADRVFVPMEGEVREKRLNALVIKGYKSAVSPKVNKVSVSKQIEKKESTKMAKQDISFGEQLKDEMIKGAYQAAGTEFAEGVRSGILAAAKHYGADEGAIAGLTQFIDSKAGKAAIEAALGHALPHVPMVGDNKHVEAIAEQMRIHGYAQGMQILMGVMFQFIMPNFSKTMANLEEKIAAANAMSGSISNKNKARIAKETHEEGEHEAAAEEEATAASPARKGKAA